MDGSRQTDGLARQFESLQMWPGAGGVTLVEDEVEHMQHGAEPLGLLLARRQPEWRAGSLDGLLGSADALRYRCIRHEKRVSNFCRSQTAHCSQCQRNRGSWS